MSEPPQIPNETPGLHQPQSQSLGQDAGVRMLIPVGRSGWAIAAGYLGLFSLILLPGPLALLCGILGIVDIKKSQYSDKPKHGLGRCFRAYYGCISHRLIDVYFNR